MPTRDAPESNEAPRPARRPSARRNPILGVASDARHVSPRRIGAVARLTLREALRLKVLLVPLLGLVALVMADLTTQRFDPVFDTMPSLIRIGLVVTTAVGLAVALFLSTYSLPREMTSRTIYSLITKPVSRLEIVVGKYLGLVAVLAIVTFGLGLLAYGYFEFRAGRIQHLARERLADGARRGIVLETDVEPGPLKRIAEEGPLWAARYLEPTEGLRIVSRGTREPAEWLSGYSTHRAHWGFADLPPEAVAGGQAVVELRAELDTRNDGGPLPAALRRIRLRVRSEESGTEWSGTVELDPDGNAVVPIPAVNQQADFEYPGGRLWVSMCGDRSVPLGVDDGSCRIRLPDGRAVASASGLKLTTTWWSNKFFLSGGGTTQALAGRYRFDRLPAEHAVLRVDVAVATATDIPPEGRASVVVVSRHGDAEDTVTTFTFRPERDKTLLIPLGPDVLDADSLDVLLRATGADGRGHPDVEIGVNPDSVRLEVGREPFALNWLVVLVLLWLSLCVLGAAGVAVSTFVGWQVAALFTGLILLLANVIPLVIDSALTGGLRMLLGTGGAGSSFRRLYAVVFRAIGTILPNFEVFDTVDGADVGQLVSDGVALPASALFALPDGAVWYALLYSAAALALGYLVLLRREVAR